MKKFKLQFTLDEGGMLTTEGGNEGFTAFEVLGLLAWKVRDVERQITGEIKPDKVSRKVITD